ncbi:MAG TPA: vitamin B12 dependent-methionine synthase activation domain-containing protein, partial [Gemmatimonadaceae bacterium]|nr:vitamin B12 dependent-methionine synthase activation domain-containing protein [Gemmatimonadaceae bacterium]
VDVLPLQVVTVGQDATLHFEKLQGAHEYTEAFYSHGLSVESAEAVAEWMHRRIKSELGIEGAHKFEGKKTTGGKRYSWGYGACPDLDDHAVVFKLLPAREALGMDHTESFQLLPEQSTAAVIIHHPEAKYYAVRGTAEAPEKTPETQGKAIIKKAATAEAETIDEAVALERAESGEISLAEARSDT